MNAKRNFTTTPHDEPDADAPLTDDEFQRGYTAILARRARAETGLSQRAFAERYGIPTASLRDWEQGRRKADNAAQCYLRVIAKMPDDVAKALHDAA
jgi:putative transcriptional regulator